LRLLHIYRTRVESWLVHNTSHVMKEKRR